MRKVVDSAGNIVSEIEYDAFGQLISVTGEKPRFRYTGKMFDDATQLQWNINRWYDPAVGRWISEDPIGFEALDTNLARFVGNEAVGKVDYLGLVWGFAPANDKPRLLVLNTWTDDTVERLAELLHLNASEYKKWLKAEDGKPLPDTANTELGTCRLFSVPNKVVYYKATRKWNDISFAVNSLQTGASIYTSQLSIAGYHTVTITSGTRTDFRSNFNDPDVLIFIFAGHGDKEYGLIYGTNDDAISPFDVSRPFAFAELWLGACYSANEVTEVAFPPRKAYWSKFVSSTGQFTGGDGLVFIWSELKSWTGPIPPSP